VKQGPVGGESRLPARQTGLTRLPLLCRRSSLLLPNNSLEPTRKRRAKIEAGPADVAATHYQGGLCR